MARLLVVEDDPDIRMLLVAKLSRQGHVVDEAGSGEEALALLGARGAPDLAVLDVLMPGMSGLDLLRILREDPAYALSPAFALMPAIVLSGRIEPGDIEAGEALGAVYLTKPVVISALLRVVEGLLQPSGAHS